MTQSAKYKSISLRRDLLANVATLRPTASVAAITHEALLLWIEREEAISRTVDSWRYQSPPDDAA